MAVSSDRGWWGRGYVAETSTWQLVGERGPALGTEAGTAALAPDGQQYAAHSNSFHSHFLPLATATVVSLEHWHRAASLRPWTTSAIMGTSHLLTPGQCVVENYPLRSPQLYIPRTQHSPQAQAHLWVGSINKEESGVLASTSMPWDILMRLWGCDPQELFEDPARERESGERVRVNG